jgi:hypothetical protein
MKALLLRRSTMDFVDFRNEVDRLRAGAAGAEEALWKEGLDRLADRLAGPVPVQAGPPAVTPEDIDEMLAREYPMSMEDLAQHLEYAVEQPDAFIQQGTAARLAERVEALDRQPWTEDQQVSLQRLRNVRPALAARERPAAENPSGETPPPDAAN